MILNAKVFRVIYVIVNVLGSLLAFNNTKALYYDNPKVELIYPVYPRIINHSEIEFKK